MKDQRKSTSFSDYLARKIGSAANIIFTLVIFGALALSFRQVFSAATQRADVALETGRTWINKYFAEFQSNAEVLQIAFQDTEMDLERITQLAEGIVESDSSIMACAVAYEPYAYKKNMEYCMPCSYRTSKGIVTEIFDNKDFDYMYQDWYMIPKLTKKSNWNDPTYDYTGQANVITSYTAPLFSKDSTFIGVVRLDIDIEKFSSIVNQYRPFKRSATIIVSKSGQFASHTQQHRVLNETLFASPINENSQITIDQCQKIMAGERGSVVYRGEEYFCYTTYAPLDNGWAMIGMCNFMYIFNTLINFVIMLLILLIAGLVIMYLVNKKLISRLTQPIVELTYSAMNMSRGNFNATIPTVQSKDELKQLETSMKYLQTSINQYISALKDSTIRKERVESELNIAKSIQMAFLSRQFPVDKDFECYALMAPAKEVGGDLYDFRKEGKYFNFAVGDVSGKGVPAALFMALTKSAFSVMKGMNLDCHTTMSRINDSCAEGNESGMFVTLFYARINLETLEMEYCNGGHNPIVIINPDGSAQYLHAKPNIAVGLFAEFPYQGESIQLQKGCRIIAYTDGVTEAEDADKNQFGEDRLIDFARKLPRNARSEEAVTTLFDKVKEFTNGNEQNDDITIFSVKV